MKNVTINYPGKQLVNRVLIKYARKFNQQEASNIRESLGKTPACAFLFIPDVGKKGNIFGRKYCPIVTYTSMFGLKTELDSEVWNVAELSPDEFKGEVYAIGLFHFSPTLLWSSAIA